MKVLKIFGVFIFSFLCIALIIQRDVEGGENNLAVGLVFGIIAFLLFLSIRPGDKKQLEEAAVLPKVIKSIPLRIETFVIINLTKIMITKLKKKDFLAEEIKLSRYDWIVSSMKGTMQGIFTRPRTLSTKGI